MEVFSVPFDMRLVFSSPIRHSRRLLTALDVSAQFRGLIVGKPVLRTVSLGTEQEHVDTPVRFLRNEIDGQFGAPRLAPGCNT